MGNDGEKYILRECDFLLAFGRAAWLAGSSASVNELQSYTAIVSGAERLAWQGS